MNTLDPSAIRATAHRVATATKAADAGVVVGVQSDNQGTSYVIWAIGTDGGIAQHKLDARFTDIQRLTAHAQGFIESHLNAWAGVAA